MPQEFLALPCRRTEIQGLRSDKPALHVVAHNRILLGAASGTTYRYSKSTACRKNFWHCLVAERRFRGSDRINRRSTLSLIIESSSERPPGPLTVIPNLRHAARIFGIALSPNGDSGAQIG